MQCAATPCAYWWAATDELAKALRIFLQKSNQSTARNAASVDRLYRLYRLYCLYRLYRLYRRVVG